LFKIGLMNSTKKAATSRTFPEPSFSSEREATAAASLIRSNNELLQYAHIASHDLQEPLRKIQMYASVLQGRDTLSASDQEIIDKILVSSNRMRTLITDLLEHSKVSRSGKMFRPVNLNNVLTKVLYDFELAIAEKQAVVSVDQLPVVSAIALEMNQLFYNLIDNALKFSDPKRIPEIAVRCKKLSEAAILEYIPDAVKGKMYYDISVRDNGIGFDVKYAEQIFMVFNRLHPKEMYPGSGIGLSLCRSILANHEGILFVESKPGEGSAFHIIIPN